MALLLQRFCQGPQRLGRPPQRRHRIPTGHRVHQLVQGLHQGRVTRLGTFTSTTGPARARVGHGQRLLELHPATPNRVAGHAHRPRHDPNPTRAQLAGLSTQPQPALPLTQMRPQNLEPAGERLHRIGHSTTIAVSQPKTRLFRHASLLALNSADATAPPVPTATGSLTSCDGRNGDGDAAPNEAMMAANTVTTTTGRARMTHHKYDELTCESSHTGGPMWACHQAKGCPCFRTRPSPTVLDQVCPSCARETIPILGETTYSPARTAWIEEWSSTP